MDIYKYFPNPSDRMGIIFALSSIEGATVIEFGPSGTTHYAVEGIGNLNGEDRAKFFSTHMSENDIAFGSHKRLENSIVEVDKNDNPKYIFVMASSVSSIIGTDIGGICDSLQDKVDAKLIPITTGGLREECNRGIEYILEVLVKEVVLETDHKTDTFNILGCNIDQFNFLSDVEEIKRMINAYFGKDVNAVFTSYSTIEEIEGAASASINIVMRKEALKAAIHMKDKFGIPYIYIKPYGIDKIDKFVKGVESVTGWDFNEEVYNKEVSEVKQHLFNIKRKFYFYNKTKKCSVIGDYDVVVGFKSIIEEIGLAIDRLQVLYRMDSIEDGILYSSDEMERLAYLKESDLLALFADATSLDSKHNSKVDLQVSNPNLSAVNIYPYTPFVGIRGLYYVLEKFANIVL